MTMTTHWPLCLSVSISQCVDISTFLTIENIFQRIFLSYSGRSRMFSSSLKIDRNHSTFFFWTNFFCLRDFGRSASRDSITQSLWDLFLFFLRPLLLPLLRRRRRRLLFNLYRHVERAREREEHSEVLCVWSLLEVLSSLPFYIEEKETNGSPTPTRTRDRVQTHRPKLIFFFFFFLLLLVFFLFFLLLVLLLLSFFLPGWHIDVQRMCVCVLSLSHRSVERGTERHREASDRSWPFIFYFSFLSFFSFYFWFFRAEERGALCVVVACYLSTISLARLFDLSRFFVLLKPAALSLLIENDDDDDDLFWKSHRLVPAWVSVSVSVCVCLSLSLVCGMCVAGSLGRAIFFFLWTNR